MYGMVVAITSDHVAKEYLVLKGVEYAVVDNALSLVYP